MQFVRYSDGSGPVWSVQTDTGIHALAAHPTGEPSYDDLTNQRYLDRLASAVENGALPVVDPDEVDRLAPVQKPGKIVCAGLNYHDHAEEQNEEVPEVPMLFSKASTAVSNPGSPIVHPGGDEQVDYEVELAAVIGRRTAGGSTGVPVAAASAPIETRVFPTSLASPRSREVSTFGSYPAASAASAAPASAVMLSAIRSWSTQSKAESDWSEVSPPVSAWRCSRTASGTDTP